MRTGGGRSRSRNRRRSRSSRRGRRSQRLVKAGLATVVLSDWPARGLEGGHSPEGLGLARAEGGHHTLSALEIMIGSQAELLYVSIN